MCGSKGPIDPVRLAPSVDRAIKMVFSLCIDVQGCSSLRVEVRQTSAWPRDLMASLAAKVWHVPTVM